MTAAPPPSACRTETRRFLHAHRARPLPIHRPPATQSHHPTGQLHQLHAELHHLPLPASTHTHPSSSSPPSSLGSDGAGRHADDLAHRQRAEASIDELQAAAAGAELAHQVAQVAGPGHGVPPAGIAGVRVRAVGRWGRQAGRNGGSTACRCAGRRREYSFVEKACSYVAYECAHTCVCARMWHCVCACAWETVWLGFCSWRAHRHSHAGARQCKHAHHSGRARHVAA